MHCPTRLILRLYAQLENHSGSNTVKEDLIEVADQYLLTHPLFLSSRPDLIRRQHEAEISRVPQLNSVRKLSSSNLIHVIGSCARGSVQRRPARTKRESGARIGAVANRLAHVGSRFGPFPELGRVAGFVGAVGREDVLAVAVPVDVELDPLRVADVAQELVEALVFGRVGGGFAPVGLRARVRGRAAVVGVPSEFPVPVYVASEAGAVAGAGLPVLSPESLGGLGVNESCNWLIGVLRMSWRLVLTIWVDKRNDVKVVFVQKGCCEFIASLVSFDQLCCDVLDSLPVVSTLIVTVNYFL